MQNERFNNIFLYIFNEKWLTKILFSYYFMDYRTILNSKNTEYCNYREIYYNNKILTVEKLSIVQPKNICLNTYYLCQADYFIDTTIFMFIIHLDNYHYVQSCDGDGRILAPLLYRKHVVYYKLPEWFDICKPMTAICLCNLC